VIRRQFDRVIETEAYHSAAAALLPYSALKGIVTDGMAIRQIADHFEVSTDLASFRLKTCKLYRRAS
jgi:Zn-dependent peptidase ImmA (M78 family)